MTNATTQRRGLLFWHLRQSPWSTRLIKIHVELRTVREVWAMGFFQRKTWEWQVRFGPKGTGKWARKRQWHYKIWDVRHCAEAWLLRKAVLYRKWIKTKKIRKKNEVRGRSFETTEMWRCVDGASFLCGFLKFGENVEFLKQTIVSQVWTINSVYKALHTKSQGCHTRYSGCIYQVRIKTHEGDDTGKWTPMRCRITV